MDFKFDFNPENVFFRCVEDCNESIMISDMKGVLVYVNPAWQRIYGYSKDEACGQTPRLLHSGQQPDDFYKKMWDQIRNPEIAHWKGELINRAKDGTLIPVLLTITPFRAGDGKIRGFMGIALDITQKREFEAKIAHQDRLASIGLLASGLAHEVGTPLGVIRGRAELLMMETENTLQRKSLSIIVAQIDRISKLIHSLLRVSRGFSDVRMEAVSLTSVVNEVLTLVGQNLKEDSVEVSLDVGDDIKVHADYARLEQIVLNLVMNSIFAIRKSIQLGRNSGHFLKVTAKLSGVKVHLLVEDSGCGIAPENMKKLFKPFYTTKDIGEGTGLGLAIVAQIIREIEGEILVKSVLGTGTVFSIILPVQV